MQLTAQQIESFEQDGDLFFPKAFSAEETGVLKQAARDVCALQREEVWREKTGVAHRDFTPIEPLADDTLRELIA